jgi:hypothetical protein
MALPMPPFYCNSFGPGLDVAEQAGGAQPMRAWQPSVSSVPVACPPPTTNHIKLFFFEKATDDTRDDYGAA